MKFPILFCSIFHLATLNAADFTWIESESPTRSNFEIKGTAWNKPELLSNGQVAFLDLQNKDATRVPEEGILLQYHFTIPSDGLHEVWNRTGMEAIRVPFDWRIDGGEWKSDSHKQNPCVDLVETSFWNPIGWSLMGSADLKAGSHLLELRIQKVMEKKGEKTEMRRIFYVSDALCFYKGNFIPNHHHRPDAAWQTEQEKQAVAQVFTLNSNRSGERSDVSLHGLWQYAAWDEIGPITEETRRKGVDSLPDLDTLHWHGIVLPGDRNAILPQYQFNHRYILRTQVEIPTDLKGKSFILELKELNLIATLFIDRKKVGDFDCVHGFWKPDVTAWMEPGQKHEIALVFKDAFYALRPGKQGETLRENYYLPMSLFTHNQGITMRLDYPVADISETGILESATLVARGKVYTEQVFIKPSVRNEQLVVDSTLRNSSVTPAKVEVQNYVESATTTGKSAELPEIQTEIPGGNTQAITSQIAWKAGDSLWWPDDPRLLTLVTLVKVDGQVVDTQKTRFGFREWEVRGNQFYLNGIRQQLRSDLSFNHATEKDLPKVAADWRDRGVTMFRLRFQFEWGGMRPSQTLDFMDEIGMPVRCNAGTFDGQRASYELANNPVLYENWHKQLRNRLIEWRNHPSIFIWELDNEIVYINARNFGKLDSAEPEFTRAVNELQPLDPTRSFVTGGGNALRDESLPVYGVHYFEVDDREYPQEAYTLEKSLAYQNSKGQFTPWPIDFAKKPIFLSETAFLPGRNAAGFAGAGGEIAMLGKSEAKPGIAKIARWLSEGYRWKGMAAFHFWFAPEFAGHGYRNSFQPVAVFCREWNWTFGSGASVPRTLKVFNETRWSDPIEVGWQLNLDGKKVTEGRKLFNLPPGDAEEFSLSLQFPRVQKRTAGELILTASRKGTEVFREIKQYTLINPTAPPKAEFQDELLVWDPLGNLSKHLQKRGIRFRQVEQFAQVPARFGALIVGNDAISQENSTDPRWRELIAAGNRILVLEQNEPLHYQAVPANFELSAFDKGRIAFIQEPDHPVFTGLADEDFSTWSEDCVVYKKPYRKASSGARSLMHCDDELGYSGIASCTANDGLLLLCQMVVGQKLESEPVAQVLFDNMLAYLANYKRVEKSCAIIADPNSTVSKVFSDLGLQPETASEPDLLIRSGRSDILVVQGNENLKKLADQAGAVRQFASDGGWLMVIGVTPESISYFNKLVGYEHMIRPFREEKVQFAPVRDPLTAGLSLSEVVMSSGRRIQEFNRDEWPVDDAFQYIVDLDEVAPFARFPGPEYWGDPQTKGPGDDTWPLNMVNGFTADAHWRMIFSIHLQKGDPTSWEMELPRTEEIIGFSIAPNRTYHEITRLSLTFDGKSETEQVFDLTGTDRQDFAVQPVKATKIKLSLLSWNPKGTSDVIGIDNLWIRAKRPADFTERVKPLLNIGGLVKYPIGKGGIILNQLHFKTDEKNPVNAQKKQVVTTTILRNLGAAFVGSRTLVAGQGLKYTPISLEGICNLYLRSASGFPVGSNDLSGVPVGRRKFTGVEYEIRDFATSPLESGIILQHPNYKVQNEKKECRDIRIERKAGALFFLHTLLPGDKWVKREGKEEVPVAFRYVVHYDDGTAVDVPVELGTGVASWLQQSPRALRDAALAWQTPANSGGQIALYQFQWNNPRPDKTIRSVDVVYGADQSKWGAPVVLGITAAEE